ncbi:MAG TPA: mannose-1-phosphate guanylyltransferase [Tepidisphaeraceae bacterium]|jgi:mannose-1-phosphate guanylyltransferase|nr:mannose-1-phosphate guanylyltransferase [Tepidisphaeraceae bacterium]
MEYGVIMAGGSGTRLWPLSRTNTPKQLLPMVRGRSLLQLAYERLRGMLPADRIFVCTGSNYAEDVYANLPELPRENLLGEPQGRDTANAVGFTAAVLHKRDPDAVLAVVSADHVIEPIERFQRAIRTGFEVAAARPKSLVTFGIIPSYGHTGLGYVQRGETLPFGTAAHVGVYKVQAFKEKPDKATADRYVESGRYYWNSGMFVWRADTVLRELALHLPDSHIGLATIASAWGTPNQQGVMDEVYPALPKISIDYAVMESASQHKGEADVAVVEMVVNWLDVGSWPALAETLKTDEHNNAVATDNFVYVDADDNIIICDDPGHLIAALGLSDTIVVHTKDATMICPKSESQRVKELLAKVNERYGAKYQ